MTRRAIERPHPEGSVDHTQDHKDGDDDRPPSDPRRTRLKPRPPEVHGCTEVKEQEDTSDGYAGESQKHTHLGQDHP